MNRFKQHPSKGSLGRLCHRGATVMVGTLLTTASLVLAQAAEESLPKIVRTYGGISPNPVLTSTAVNSNGITVKWQAFGKQVTNGVPVYQLVKCPALKGSNATWNAIATVTNLNTATLTTDGEAGFITVQQDPAPAYAGSDRCSVCHIDTHEGWLTTRHAGAFQTLKNIHVEKNPSCLPCHSVGFGTPNGFQDEVSTPGLAGVQCENCHGPAGGHASRPLDQTKRPLKTLSAEMCGGCHTDAHHPTYDEWASSAHGTTVIPEEEFADPAAGPARMLTCGACHSAATRLALLKGATGPNPLQLPSTEEAATTGITCVACHEAHADTGNPGQLRFPLHSEMPYSYNTGTNFTANFNPQVQTCAQCHNMRGASWKGTSRPPHHSPQYNILIGNGGFEGGAETIPQSAHMKIENQCAQCHTHAHSPDEITEAAPAFTGHDFKPTMQGCAPCHDEVGGALLTEVVQGNVKQQIAEVKGLLDQWALTKAPEALRTKYGALAWEFQNIGQLSKATPQVPTGPTAAEQGGVPDNIKQARHNIYMIEHDGSYGVHNGNYARFLLKVARDRVKAEL